MNKKVIISLVLAVWLVAMGVVLTFTIGFLPQWFNKEGIYIELTYAFKECDVIYPTVNFCLETNNYQFIGRNDEITVLNSIGVDTLQEYIDKALLHENLSGLTELYDDDEARFYYVIATPDEHSNLATAQLMIFMESDTHYYRMTFQCDKDDILRFKSRFLRWATSIRVD